MTLEPTSKLTRERPDIWRRSLDLATTLTSYAYAPKLPLADGTIYACGYRSPDEQRKYDISYVNYYEGLIKKYPEDEKVAAWRDLLRVLKEKLGIKTLSVSVPEGAMEWLLHETGHWVAATSEERELPNYGLSASEQGHDGEREWQAWAFEEIVLAPFGHVRQFAPPSQRDGAAFSKNGPMPTDALHHVERQILALGLDVQRWRIVYGEWIRWGRRHARAPWEQP